MLRRRPEEARVTQVKDVMTKDPIICDASASVSEAARAMRAADVGDVIVVEQGELAGILTDRDIAVRVVAQGISPTNARIGDACTRELVALSPDDDVAKALDQMRGHSVRRLPVVAHDKPVGIVSMGDLAKQLDLSDALAEISDAPPNQ
jgi:CBS domain-containing protein